MTTAKIGKKRPITLEMSGIILVKAKYRKGVGSMAEKKILTYNGLKKLEAELEARKQQYEYYRNKLLTFNELGGGY